jgi:hypothetical protein
MTRGKKALSLIPRNHLIVKRPPKFFTAATHKVQVPKTNIIKGSTLFGPNFFPAIPRKGAVST